nr:MAG TPA: hypothetical protein [Caudoviricetes sp.]
MLERFYTLKKLSPFKENFNKSAWGLMKTTIKDI